MFLEHLNTTMKGVYSENNAYMNHFILVKLFFFFSLYLHF